MENVGWQVSSRCPHWWWQWRKWLVKIHNVTIMFVPGWRWQFPTISVQVLKLDTLNVEMDTLNVEMDTLNVEMDALNVEMDPINVEIDVWLYPIGWVMKAARWCSLRSLREPFLVPPWIPWMVHEHTHTHTHTQTYLVHVTLCYTLLCLIVFIADTGKECFVWVGKGASQNERRQAMSYSHVRLYPLQSIHYTVLLLLLL